MNSTEANSLYCGADLYGNNVFLVAPLKPPCLLPPGLAIMSRRPANQTKDPRICWNSICPFGTRS